MNQEIILYSTGCPRCKVLTKKLKEFGVDYKLVTDVEKMTSLGLKEAPALSVDGVMLNFKNALEWIKNYSGGRDEY